MTAFQGCLKSGKRPAKHRGEFREGERNGGIVSAGWQFTKRDFVREFPGFPENSRRVADCEVEVRCSEDTDHKSQI